MPVGTVSPDGSVSWGVGPVVPRARALRWLRVDIVSGGLAWSRAVAGVRMEFAFRVVCEAHDSGVLMVPVRHILYVSDYLGGGRSGHSADSSPIQYADFL